jgi:hypothetical protein
MPPRERFGPVPVGSGTDTEWILRDCMRIHVCPGASHRDPLSGAGERIAVTT